MGVPEVLNADNDLSASGAVWDFTDILGSQGLSPDTTSAPKELKFQLSQLRPALRSGKYYSGIINMQAEVLGTLRQNLQSAH